MDLHESVNISCIGGCTKLQRAENTEDDLCLHTVSATDNLNVRCVGYWARKKILLLTKYFAIFCKGMKAKWKGNINYIEICSGPGRCIVRDEQKEIDGTAMALIGMPEFSYLRKAVFIDINPKVVNILNSRIFAQGVSDKAKACVGDYTNPSELIELIDAHIGSRNGLNLFFIDPTDCSVPFSTIKHLHKVFSTSDLILNFAIGSDMIRNIKQAILKPSHSVVKSKYESFLGVSLNTPELIELAQHPNNDQLIQKLINIYTDSLKSLGYQYFDQKKVEHFYHIWFASSHPKGLDFWAKANKISVDLQRELF